MNSLDLIAVKDFPVIEVGDNLVEIISSAVNSNNLSIDDNDIFVIAHKIISKSENRYINLNEIKVSEDAAKLALKLNKDKRLVQVIMNESNKIISTNKNVIVVEHKLGIVNINAGIDLSNIPIDSNIALLLPKNPSKSADNLQNKLSKIFNKNISIVISDSMTRPYRSGVVNFAIASSNINCLLDLKGEIDMYGKKLKGTEVAVADELAASAGLLMGQSAEMQPVILIKGYKHFNNEINDAATLTVDKSDDLYR